jgi:thiamine-phosphate pyrophosphorylase
MLVTDRHRCGPHPLIEAIDLAVAAGVDALQLREKDLEAGELYELALVCRRITAGRCAFVVNGRVDVALATGADGVHLPERGLPIEAVHRIAPAGFLVGRSVHSVSGALEAETQGAGYVQLGTIFDTDSKPGLESAGVELVRKTANAIHIPCLAVGGIDAQNAGTVLAAGAQGVAVVSAILGAEDVTGAVHSIRMALAAPLVSASSPSIGTGPG